MYRSREKQHRCVYNEIIVLYLHQKTKTIPNYQMLSTLYMYREQNIKLPTNNIGFKVGRYYKFPAFSAQEKFLRKQTFAVLVCS